MTQPFLLAQISDLHITASGRLSYRVVDTVGMVRAYAPATGLVSHTAYVGEFPGPYSFRDR